MFVIGRASPGSPVPKSLIDGFRKTFFAIRQKLFTLSAEPHFLRQILLYPEELSSLSHVEFGVFDNAGSPQAPPNEPWNNVAFFKRPVSFAQLALTRFAHSWRHLDYPPIQRP